MLSAFFLFSAINCTILTLKREFLMSRLGILFFIAILAGACHHFPEQWNLKREKKEIIKEYYPSGRIKSINESVDNKRHGVCKYYYEDGKLKAIAHFNMNKYQGEQISYYPSGKIRGKVNYDDNKKHGLSYGYYGDETLYIKENYEFGRLNGLKQKFYDNGQLMMENHYLDGKPSIHLKEYDIKGNLITDYPKLVIKPVNRVFLDNTYVLKIYFSNKTRSGNYYIDELTEGKFLPSYSIPLDKTDRIANYIVEVPPGFVIMKEIKIIASMKTKLGHTRVVSKSYNLGVKH